MVADALQNRDQASRRSLSETFPGLATPGPDSVNIGRTWAKLGPCRFGLAGFDQPYGNSIEFGQFHGDLEPGQIWPHSGRTLSALAASGPDVADLGLVWPTLTSIGDD